jgi:hypothetical protein
MMGYIEYLATLVSPHPKETIKAIEQRHKMSNLEKIRNGEQVNTDDLKLFHDDHRNTTFFDAIAAEGGDQALADLKALFNERPEDAKAVEMYTPKVDDLEYIQRAMEKPVNGGIQDPTDGPVEFDTIEF